MRKLNIQEVGQREISPVKQVLSDDFHANARTADIVGYNHETSKIIRSKVEEWVLANNNLLVVPRSEKESIKEVGPLVEKIITVIDQVVDAFLVAIRPELDASRIGANADDLKNNFLNKAQILSRVIVDFAYSQHRFDRQEAPAEYELLSHRILLNAEQIIDGMGEFNLKKFVEVLIHELVHFFSNNEVLLPSSLKDKIPDIAEVVPLATGFQRATENGREIIFVGFNEAVVQMFTAELFEKISVQLKDKYPDLGSVSIEKGAYNTEISIVSFVIECLAKYNGVPEKIVWQSLKRGLLQGDVLLDSEINKGLVECFGEDVLINFFRKMEEHNLFFRYKGPQPRTTSVFDLNKYRKMSLKAALEKRWKQMVNLYSVFTRAFILSQIRSDLIPQPLLT